MVLAAKLLDDLKAIVGAENVLTDAFDLSLYDADAETLDTASPDLVVLPASTEEVAAVVKVAAELAPTLPVTARGAGTGLSGGATCVRGGLSLVLTRMNKVLHIDAAERAALVQVGATNVSVSRQAEPHGLYFAPDPSSQIASTIGGNIAENAGGPHTLKYGMTTHHVLALGGVNARGEVVALGGFNRGGLDLTGVVIGSEGTLLVVTEALLRLTPVAAKVETLLAYFSTVRQCGQAVSDIVAQGVVPAAMEMIDNLTLNAVEDYLGLGLRRDAQALLIIELDGVEAGIACARAIVEKCLLENGLIESRWAENARERADIWKARKTSFGALGRIAPHGYVLDGVIPRSRLAEAIEGIAKIGERHGLTIANVYHAGDGNLHPCMLYHREDQAEVARVISAGREILHLCVDLGGTLSGEHGIGVEKLMEMESAFGPQDLEFMGLIKTSLDPDGRLNPGKVLPQLKTCGEAGARPLLRHQQLSC
ncbi:MAG: FAD-linked oxidase C-terminal domain-containing protein [Candidatus Obscuribacter sp.]|nr:FAD-linked oxidase C-terminal domain-containing protein [Candidatus Obscuribacter sp.]